MAPRKVVSRRNPELRTAPGSLRKLGFSVANLRNFRQFYLTYPDPEVIHYALHGEMSWTHDRLIMTEDDNPTLGIIFCVDKDETERQLLYVAATRAREHLLITAAFPGSEFLSDLE